MARASLAERTDLAAILLRGFLAMWKVLGLLVLFVLVAAGIIWAFVSFVTLENAWLLIPGCLIFFALMLLFVYLAKIPIGYNIRNLIVRFRTTLLTAIAFTMVIGVLTFLMGFINGLKKLTSSTGNPENVVVLAQGATDEGISNLPFENMGDLAQQEGVVRMNDEPLCSRESYLVLSLPIAEPKPGSPTRRLLQLRGLFDPVASAKVHDFELEEGGVWFSPAGVRPSEDPNKPPYVEVVLGQGIARQLGGDRSEAQRQRSQDPNRLVVGDTIQLDRRELLVTGIMKTEGTTFDSEVWAKQSVIGPLLGKTNFTTLVLRATSADKAQKLEDFFTGKDQDNKYEKSQVNAFTETNYYKSLSQTNLQLLVGTIVVATVMGFGGVMGVMNTMFAAISQRVKDIGMLRLIGFSRWRILVSFLTESLLIALLGGMVGCLIGYLFNGYQVTSIVGGGGGPGGKAVVFRVVIDWGVLGIGLTLSMLMGFFGGLVPALSAMRFKPLESLRG
jgi:putative ABC transport system permease protein